MSVELKIPKKLIEVALPLDSINEACAYEKNPGIGAHPRGLHLWWARRPLAAARGILFAQMVNDPGYERHLGRGLNRVDADKERERLFKIIQELVDFDNISNPRVINEALAEIKRSWVETCNLNKDIKDKSLFDPERLPPVCDPFAGGGAIPLEAQRLGMSVRANDFNPVATLINKAMIEFPQRFISRRPVHRNQDDNLSYKGLDGLIADILAYGRIVEERAKEVVGGYYPELHVTKEMVKKHPDLAGFEDKKFVVTTYLWTRTIKCPNPACGIETPLLSSFVVSSKKNRERYIHASVKGEQVVFDIKDVPPATDRDPSDGLKRGMSGIFECIKCRSVTTRDYTAQVATERGLGQAPVAIVVPAGRSKLFLPANLVEFHLPDIQPSELDGLNDELAPNPRDVWCRNFGLKTPSSLFTKRQLKVHLEISKQIRFIEEEVRKSAIVAGFADDNQSLDTGGKGALAYAELVKVYLAFALDRTADYNSQLCTWKPSGEQVMQTFKRQTLPMTWDFPESNIFSGRSICWSNSVKYTVESIGTLPKEETVESAVVSRGDARMMDFSGVVVSTDPPYYDNIGYADLSDFFYVWLKKTIGESFPTLFLSTLVPKQDEMVAIGYRHESSEKANQFFMVRMTETLSRIANQSNPLFPITIYYAFKQSDTSSEGTSSTGWESFLEAVIGSGLSITGTWPLRTEQSARIIGAGTNALASSVVLVCRKRNPGALSISRREFIRELNRVLPEALSIMTQGGAEVSSVAPVDLSQAIIGPGMEIFSKHATVLEADGSPMTVKVALQLINRFLAQDDFDHDTQFCLSWFEQFGWETSQFGTADVLARAKGTSVDGLKDGGVVESSGGNLRLLRPQELVKDWLPESDSRLSIWEILHQMINKLVTSGEVGAGFILSKCNSHSEQIRTLAYRLYTLCERKGWAQDAGQYNALVVAWDAIEAAARSVGYSGTQISLFGENETTENQTTTKKKSKRNSR